MTAHQLGQKGDSFPRSEAHLEEERQVVAKLLDDLVAEEFRVCLDVGFQVFAGTEQL